MAKHLISLVFLALALFLAADASILRTTVSEVEDSGASCRIKTLTPCMNWVRYSSMAEDEEWDAVNPSTGGSQQYKKECCRMMHGMNMDCMCSSLKHTFRDKCSSGQSFRGQGGEMCGQMMTQKLMNVPKMCGFADQPCPYTSILV